jgi:hypothetical protein
MKKIILVIIIIFSTIFLGCNSSKKTNTTFPAWVNETISNFEKENDRAEISEYLYKGDTVYMVSYCYHCPDAIDAVYDKEGKKLCEFGGIDGRDTCPGFFEEATNKKVIWRNKKFKYD